MGKLPRLRRMRSVSADIPHSRMFTGFSDTEHWHQVSLPDVSVSNSVLDPDSVGNRMLDVENPDSAPFKAPKQDRLH
jgi:hypothetical protein